MPKFVNPVAESEAQTQWRVLARGWIDLGGEEVSIDYHFTVTAPDKSLAHLAALRNSQVQSMIAPGLLITRKD